MTHPQGKENVIRTPPYKTAGVVALVLALLVTALVYWQFRGNFTPKTPLTLLSARAGLVMDPGNPVTYNGVQIGRVGSISEVQHNGKPAAKFTLNVNPKYIKLIPANVNANIRATTVFGNKYVALTSPKNPSPQHITPEHVIDATSVTTEINTLFQTITSISEKVDPVKVNLTLSGAAQALNGLGDKFGQSLVKANAVLDDVNPQQPQVRHDIQQLAALGDTYANAAPDLVDFLNNAVITARTLHRQEKDLDQALLAAAGLGNTGEDIFRRGGPYLERGAADLVPTAKLLDTYSPELYCTVRNYHDVEPKIAAGTGGRGGYALRTETEALSGLGAMASPLGIVLLGAGPLVQVATLPLAGTPLGPAGALVGLGLAPLGAVGLIGGAPNPYIYPENLPRVNARGGPGGAPGCWQTITRDFWPAPELVMDTGNSVAPYNHLDTGSPYAIEYVWGRQVGDNTINP
jgi:phospholipid/cholesterol/gamma-HCH transport system substrate-binding protein